MAITTLPPLQDGQLSFLDSLAKEFEEAFAELAESAEKELSGKPFIFSSYGRELYPYFETTDASLVPGCIVPIKEGRPVASVDSTCVLVGETSQGALYAARTAVGISYEGALKRFFRLGPILVYATSAGLSGLVPHMPSSELDLLLSDHAVAERFIRNTVERRVIEALSSGDGSMIVMADGSLKHPMGQFGSSMSRRGSGGRTMVGFSKSSNLILSEDAMASLSKSPVPSYHVLSRGACTTVLAKFTPDGLVFRLDVSSPEQAETVLGRIAWNDAFASGYPDSLKVAHHLSIFSKADDQALKAFVSKRFGVRRLQTFPLRKIALGSFRGGA
ncbi:MAG: DNA double-strand break repair nuclease NurA [Nitrososphaerota archaeon]|nr:DNA double-strand break repair nuclease NurA [Nitrososphaerota archaeon]